MAEEKETREELEDLDPKKDPKGGFTIQHDNAPDPTSKGVDPKYRG